MKQSELCLIYNIAPKYREGIYRLIDSEYPCHWYFGRNNTDIKGLDFSVLRNVVELDVVDFRFKTLSWQKGVMALLDRPEYDTFFIYGDVFSLSTWALLLKRKLRYPHKRIYVWAHGWYGKEALVMKWLKKRFFRLADGIFLYGNHARRLMIKEGFDPAKLFVIHNSLAYDEHLKIRQTLRKSDLYRRHFGNDAPNLIFIGRLTPQKSLGLLVEAVKLLRQKGVTVNLTFVGDGPERTALEAAVAGTGLGENVWFYGACYDEAVNASLIYNADICVSPGNVGLTAIHSMTFGTPVITHNNFPWQMPEFEAITEGTTGAFFDYGSASSLADAIEKWLAGNSSRRDEIRRACFAEIDSSWTPRFQIGVIRANLPFHA